MDWKVKVVIHTEFGGFALTGEMIEMLKARGCTWADRCGGPFGGQYYLPSEEAVDAQSFRNDPDLVAVVEELTQRYEKKIDSKKGESIPWRERVELRGDMLANLKVVEVTVSIEISDHDGRETISVHGGVW